MKARVQNGMHVAPKPAFTLTPVRRLQRMCACGGSHGPDAECSECRSKRLSVQRSPIDQIQRVGVASIVDEVLRAPGQPLDAATRAFMEPRLGYDISRVLVHTDARAADSARAINAHAYTVGQDIVFAAGRHRPETSEGRSLLAHELTHTIQQREAVGTAGFDEHSPSGVRAEREAQEASDHVAAAGGLAFFGCNPSPFANSIIGSWSILGVRDDHQRGAMPRRRSPQTLEIGTVQRQPEERDPRKPATQEQQEWRFNWCMGHKDSPHLGDWDRCIKHTEVWTGRKFRPTLKKPLEPEKGAGEKKSAPKTKAASTTASSVRPEVFLCRRIADLPGNKVLGVEHWWIKTPSLEAGMGPAQGGVPGHGGSDIPYVTQTAITQHAGEGLKPESTCQWVGELDRFGAHQWAKVDHSCLERELQIGRPTGRWTPLNQCQTTIKRALDKCSPAVTFEPKYLGLGVRLDSDGIIRQYGGPKL